MRRMAAAALLSLLALAAGCAMPAVVPTPAPTPTMQPRSDWVAGIISSQADFDSARVLLFDEAGLQAYEVPLAAAGIQAGRFFPPAVSGRQVGLFVRRAERILLYNRYAMEGSWLEVNPPDLLCGGKNGFFGAYAAPEPELAILAGKKTALPSAALALCADTQRVWVAVTRKEGPSALAFDQSTLSPAGERLLPDLGAPWCMVMQDGALYVAYRPDDKNAGTRIARCAEGETRVIDLGAGAPALQIIPAGSYLVVNRYAPAEQEGDTVVLISPSGETRQTRLTHQAVQIAYRAGRLYVTDREWLYAYALPDMVLEASVKVLDDPSTFSGLIVAEE